MKEQFSDYSIHRINLIKDNFNSIIENILSPGSKSYMAAQKAVNRAEFMSKARGKKRRKKYDSKQEDDLKEVYFNAILNSSLVDRIKRDGKEMSKIFTKIQNIVKNLVKLRNSLFNQYFKIEEMWKDHLLPKEDIAKFYEFMEEVKKRTPMTAHSLWDLKAKKHENKEYDSGELTE